ncbi:hypothetical protein FEM48_Zijuj01G0289000 [Ziziphus jujuba var. spinosa]|uniref:Mediator of RNA polymerase II transcription subunit 11 n=1 Tax=Ziziphus jujuba var. spinosa TaxID=714518 RepID=A0A978W5K9_ZIZJJ|nr:hypothetical protein FEM48_Zijuj01G0289000 [Ziziphus jujuba var. spinosa]
MDSQTQNTSLQRLQNVEKRIVRVLELAGGVMDELSNPSGPRKEFVNNHCGEFMQLIKMWSNGNHTVNNVERLELCLIMWYCWVVSSICPAQLRVYHDEALKLGDIQVSLREEIKSACDYRPFEKCDYSSRIANEICCKKLEYVISQLDGMKQTIDEYHSEV